MQKEMNNDLQRTLMIEEMMERGEVYEGYRENQKFILEHKRFYNKCTKERFLSEFSYDLTWGEIALKLGISKYSARELGIYYGIHKKQKNKNRTVSDAQLIEAFKEYPRKAIKEIKDDLKLSFSTVWRRAKELGLL
jgi:hypothetical protein